MSENIMLEQESFILFFANFVIQCLKVSDVLFFEQRFLKFYLKIYQKTLRWRNHLLRCQKVELSFPSSEIFLIHYCLYILYLSSLYISTTNLVSITWCSVTADFVRWFGRKHPRSNKLVLTERHISPIYTAPPEQGILYIPLDNKMFKLSLGTSISFIRAIADDQNMTKKNAF